MEAGLITTTRQDALVAWFSLSRRDLPWRETRDPWAILVSETMLQQTQVDRVIPKFQAFMEAFPDVWSCATAPSGDVVRLWDGLGYNRRALFLHRAACSVVEHHNGIVPTDMEALLALPGVGQYTARAVMVFAYEADEGVLDTNVARVLARAFAGRRLALKEAQQLATSVVPAGNAWSWNQAMLDLGATVCRKRAPACGRCPLASTCTWRSNGGALPDPAERSAATSMPQSKFVGSDREGRGRIISVLRTRTVALHELARTAGWPDDEQRAAAVLQRLLDEGLVIRRGDELSLPG